MCTHEGPFLCRFYLLESEVKRKLGSAFAHEQTWWVRLVTIARNLEFRALGPEKVQRSVSWNEKGCCVKDDAGASLEKDKEGVDQGGRESFRDGEGPKVFFFNVRKYFFERRIVKFDSKLKKVRIYIVRKVP